MKLILTLFCSSVFLILNCCSDSSKKSSPKTTAPSLPTPAPKETFEKEALKEEVHKPTLTTIYDPILTEEKIAQAAQLWDLAPKKSIMGAVAIPTSGQNLYSMFMEIVTTLEKAPFGKKTLAELRKEIQSWPLNPLVPDSMSQAGLDLNLAAAIFLENENSAPYMILPVSDPIAFLKLTGGRSQTLQGIQYDYHSAHLVCTQKHQRYFCAGDPKSLDSFGEAVHSPLAKKVSTLPTSHRGDLELVADMGQLQKMDSDPTLEFIFNKISLGVLALRQTKGALSLYFWLQAKPKDSFLQASTLVSNHLAAAKMSESLISLIHLRVPMALFVEEFIEPPEFPLPKGLKFKDDILGSMSGELLVHSSSRMGEAPTLSIGLKNSDAWKILLSTLCLKANDIPEISSHQKKDRCSLDIQKELLPLSENTLGSLLPNRLSISAEVKQDRFEMSLGKYSSPAKEKSKAHKRSRLLLGNDWNLAFWEENTGFIHSLPLYVQTLQMLPPEPSLDMIQFGLWLYAHIFELGFAGAIREDGLHGFLQIRSYCSQDSQKNYEAFESVLVKVFSGQSIDADLKIIKKTWPMSLSGQINNSKSSNTLMILFLAIYMASNAEEIPPPM